MLSYAILNAGVAGARLGGDNTAHHHHRANCATPEEQLTCQHRKPDTMEKSQSNRVGLGY